MQENAVVVANGRVSVKEEEAARLIVEGVQPIEHYDPSQYFRQKPGGKSQPRDRRGRDRRLFPDRAQPPGARRCTRWKTCCATSLTAALAKVYFRFADTGQKVLARHMAIKDDPLLRAELERILGKDCVKVQTAEQNAK